MENPENNPQQLMVSILTQIGCQPMVNDDTVRVSYQGENFQIDFGGPYVQIWDPGWAAVASDDPSIPAICEAINLTNACFGPTVLLSVPDEEGTRYLHTRYSILFFPEIPGIDEYMRSSLDLFFRVKDIMRKNFQKVESEQQISHEKKSENGFRSAAEKPENLN